MISSRRVAPFTVRYLTGKNTVKLDLPENCKNHPVVYVSNTMPCVELSAEIGQTVHSRPEQIITVEWKACVVDKIRNHINRGKRHQILTLMKDERHHDAMWQTSSDFVDRDGTVTDIWLAYTHVVIVR